MRNRRLSVIAVCMLGTVLPCTGMAATYADAEQAITPADTTTHSTPPAPAPTTTKAAGDNNQNPKAEIAVEKDETSVFDFLNAPQKNISSGLEWLSKRIDVFFANEKIYDESTGSYARLSGTTILRDGGKKSFLGDLNIRVELPHTQKKLNLIIESDADKNLAKRPDQQSQPTPNQALSATTYFAGIDKNLSGKSAWDIHTSVGIKLHVPLDPFVRLRMTREALFVKWKFHFTETLFHFHSRGNGYDSTMEWDRSFGRKNLFRLHTSATWWDDTDLIDLNQSFTVFHEITERRAVSYSIGVFGKNKPIMQADTYLIDIRYRQLLHKDWLFYEINPQVLYQKSNDFQPEHSVALKLEMIFGADHF